MTELSDQVAIQTERGAILRGRVTLPDVPASGNPGVVVAPGANYDMDQPLTSGAARVAAESGYVALQFDWHFYASGEARTDGDEHDDLRSALRVLQARDDVNADSVVVIGKSLGSIVGHQVAIDAGIEKVILLTPVCRSADDLARNYAGLGPSTVMIVGDEDPLCHLDTLFAGLARTPAHLSIIGGDHGFGAEGNQEQSERNVAIALETVRYWLRSWRPT